MTSKCNLTGLDIGRLEGRKQAFEEVLEEIDNVFKHSNEEHPEHCGCYMCHHQEEYKDVWNELKQKIKEKIEND